jgi:hypothetical protein
MGRGTHQDAADPRTFIPKRRQDSSVSFSLKVVHLLMNLMRFGISVMAISAGDFAPFV